MQDHMRAYSYVGINKQVELSSVKEDPVRSVQLSSAERTM